MGYRTVQSAASDAWGIARRQHGVVARRQLIGLGLHPQAIKHRLAIGRLHRTAWRGVYAVGRPGLTRRGVLMGAVLASGAGAALSHGAAAGLWRMGRVRSATIDVSVPAHRHPRGLRGVTAHRRAQLGPEVVGEVDRIPVTTPVFTLIDLATVASIDQLTRAVNDADKLGLVDPESLRSALERRVGLPGTAILRRLLDRHTFDLTDSELERRFLELVDRLGLPKPRTQQWVNGHRVDFFWPDLGLVVETDGLRYHRTAAQQTADRRRDQAHVAAGLTSLRFSRAQVAFDPRQVESTLLRVASRLAGAEAGGRLPLRARRRRRRAG